MKGICKLPPILCICWYLVCVTGFDIHYCGDNGCVYVEPLFAGISCESIHPDIPCHHPGHGCCDGDEECCHDVIALLDVPGDGSGSQVAAPVPFLTLAAVLPSRTVSPVPVCMDVRHISDSSSPPGGFLSRFSILRI